MAKDEAVYFRIAQLGDDFDPSTFRRSENIEDVRHEAELNIIPGETRLEALTRTVSELLWSRQVHNSSASAPTNPLEKSAAEFLAKLRADPDFATVPDDLNKANPLNTEARKRLAARKKKQDEAEETLQEILTDMKKKQ